MAFIDNNFLKKVDKLMGNVNFVYVYNSIITEDDYIIESSDENTIILKNLNAEAYVKFIIENDEIFITSYCVDRESNVCNSFGLLFMSHVSFIKNNDGSILMHTNRTNYELKNILINDVRDNLGYMISTYVEVKEDFIIIDKGKCTNEYKVEFNYSNTKLDSLNIINDIFGDINKDNVDKYISFYPVGYDDCVLKKDSMYVINDKIDVVGEAKYYKVNMLEDDINQYLLSYSVDFRGEDVLSINSEDMRKVGEYFLSISNKMKKDDKNNKKVKKLNIDNNNDKF